ncbi:MAG: four helix bundle protein [Terriglobia bacterium]|jgi:four helix bundle protein
MTEPVQPAKTFQDLIVWRKAHEFVLRVYTLTKDFPRQETYALCSQLRRAAVAVPGNIAEGFRRRGRADKVRFMNIAEGSLEECRYYLILAQDLGYPSTEDHRALLEEISGLLHAYSKAILAAVACHSDS